MKGLSLEEKCVRIYYPSDIDDQNPGPIGLTKD